MSELTREQFRAAVAGAIEGVEHLYRQVELLVVRLREELSEGAEPLALKRGTLGRAGKKDSRRVVVRHEYGALFEPADDDDDEADELDEDGDEGEDDEPDGGAVSTSRRKGKRRHHEIVTGQPLLAVRIAMFDPRKRDAFEPHIQFAVLSDWTLGDAPAQPDDRFTVDSYMLRRVARALADRTGPPNSTRVRTSAAARPIGGTAKGQKVKSRKLTCLAPAGVQAVPSTTSTAPTRSSVSQSRSGRCGHQ